MEKGQVSYEFLFVVVVAMICILSAGLFLYTSSTTYGISTSRNINCFMCKTDLEYLNTNSVECKNKCDINASPISSQLCVSGITRWCLTGRPGICADGIETCVGSIWSGTCVQTNMMEWNCTNGLDNDCNGIVDALEPGCAGLPVCTDADGDGYNVTGGICGPLDCDDNNASINPGKTENCTNGYDDNCDLMEDCFDASCLANPLCPPVTAVSTCQDLQNMKNDLNKNYFLTSDIDCSETVTWNGGKGFEPIGTSASWFRGFFNGVGHKITDLYINRPGEDRVGLFGVASGQILNVNLENVIVTGRDFVGGLGGTISIAIGSYVSGEVHGADVVGGIAGVSSVIKSRFSGGVDATGNDVGGIAGRAIIVDLSYASGDISGSNNVGGISGNSTAMITYSNFSGTVVATGNNVGGLAGVASVISGSYASGDFSGSNNVGGLIGICDGPVKSIIGSYASGDVSGSDNVGGLTGSCEGLIQVSNFSGIVQGSGDNVGGLAGISQTIEESYASVRVLGSENVGGLSGHVFTITRSSATGNITGVENVGGLAGIVSMSISRSSFSGIVNGGNGNYIGGLGGNVLSVSASVARGLVTSTGDYVGGLVGLIGQGASRSYFKGNVFGSNNVGGLIGGYSPSGSMTSDCYVDADVHASGANVGGLVGLADGNNDFIVINSYSRGSVNGSMNVGGLVGLNNRGKIKSSYSIVSPVVGLSNVGGLLGSRTPSGPSGVNFDPDNSYFIDAAHDNGYGNLELGGESNFYGNSHDVYTASGNWDFDSTWRECFWDLPELRWETNICVPS